MRKRHLITKTDRRIIDRSNYGCSSDSGFTLTEFMFASALASVVLVAVLVWLINTIRNNDILTDAHDDDRELGLILDAVIEKISKARPTALCLAPDPNNRTEPETRLTGNSRCTEVGENWGYWPTDTEFRPGGPFHEVKEDRLCYFARPDSAVIDLAKPKSPWGACIELDDDRQVRAGVLEPGGTAKNNYLAAAIPSNYDWESGAWTWQTLGTADSIVFSYEDFDGVEMSLNVADSDGGYKLDSKLLDDISLIHVTITRTQNHFTRELSGSLSVRANRFSPCKRTQTEDTYPATSTTTIGPPQCPSEDPFFSPIF